MEEETVTDASLREFLLGKVDDEERERIERLFITDSQVREKILTAEQDLIEDYLEDNLTTSDRERFVSRYAQTPEQQRKLRITRSIKEWAAGQAAIAENAPAISSWNRLRARLRPVVVTPIAATLIVAIVIAVVWLNSRSEQKRQHLAIEQELAELNSPASLRRVLPQMISFDLPPGSMRSVEEQTEIKTGADIRTVEFHLAWIQKQRYPAYQAEVHRIGDNESFAIHNLQADTNGGNAIQMRLPAQILHRGQYQIDVSGIASDGTVVPAEEYTFTVGD